MKKHLLEILNLFGFPVHWNDVGVASISLPGPTSLNGPISFYNLRWYAHGPDDIGNKGSGCVS